MSSEAAYFPDALANDSEVHDAVRPGHEVSVDSSIKASEESSETAAQLSDQSDKLLLERVQQGDKDALGILFRRHARAVRNIACRILRNEAEADDLVQEVFLFIFRKAALFNAESGAARSWIFQVAYHRAFDRRRYLGSRHFYTSQDIEDAGRYLADPREEPHLNGMSMEGIFGKQLTARFNARLTPEQRETIQLFFFEGYPLKEIAEITGRPLVNVRSHYYRGLARLRKYFLPEKLRSK